MVLFITTAFCLHSRYIISCVSIYLDIADKVWSNSGTFWVKLRKKQCVSLKNAKLKWVKTQNFRKITKLKCLWHEKYFPLIWKAFMAFFFLKYLFSFYRYWRFSIMQIRSVMMSYCLQLKMVKCWINNISRNIKAVFLKLGTINVHHKRNKMTPSMVLL